MRFLSHLTYANVIATAALFLALGGTAAAGAQLLVTGADVQDHSLTGADIKHGSLGAGVFSKLAIRELKGDRGARGVSGASGASGPQGPAGAAGQSGSAGSKGADGIGIATTLVSGSDQAGYVDLAPLATTTLSQSGDYVIFTSLTVHNTGLVGEYLNCGYDVNGTINGASGVQTNAGDTASGTSAGVVTASGPTTISFVCQGGGGTTYDISSVQMRIHYLG